MVQSPISSNEKSTGLIFLKGPDFTMYLIEPSMHVPLLFLATKVSRHGEFAEETLATSR